MSTLFDWYAKSIALNIISFIVTIVGIFVAAIVLDKYDAIKKKRKMKKNEKKVANLAS